MKKEYKTNRDLKNENQRDATRTRGGWKDARNAARKNKGALRKVFRDDDEA